MAGLRWHDELPEPDEVPALFSGGYHFASEDIAFNKRLMPEFYAPDPSVAGRSSVP